MTLIMKQWPLNKTFLVTIVILSFFVFGACRQQMGKEEAVSHLVAFDNEVVRMTQGILESPSRLVLEHLSGMANNPLPCFFGNGECGKSSTAYHLESFKGTYRLDTITNMFIKTAASDSVIIHFHNPWMNHAETTITLAKYKEEPLSGAFQFPTQVDLLMEVGDRTVMRIDHKATLMQGIPTEIDFYGLFDHYEVRSTISTRLRRINGRLRFTTYVQRNGEEIFELVLRAGLTFKEGLTYRLNRVRIDMEMSPIRLNAMVNNHKIPLRTNDYLAAFNENSKIRIHSVPNNQLLGHVELRERENSDKLDYSILFKDGSYLFMEDFLVSVRSFLNIKL